MNSFELLICVILISISAFLSASEIALFSISRFQLRSLKERSASTYRVIKRLLSDPSGLLVTLLLVNEVVNISLSTLVTNAVVRGWTSPEGGWLRDLSTHFFPTVPDWLMQTILGTLITAPLVLFFCEITPKVIGAGNSQVVAPLSSGPLSFIYDTLRPVRYVLGNFIKLLSRLAYRWQGHTPPDETDEVILREKEFLFMIEEGHKEGAIHESELELIRNVFALDDRRVQEILTPLSRVYALPTHTTLKEALAALRNNRFSRIPVVASGRKQIQGIVYAKDLILARLEPDFETRTVSSLMRKPVVVSPGMRLNTLFSRLKQHKTHVAVVEEKPGEALGIVTMNDVLDELFEVEV